jgi:RNA polymerase sigma factor (TIGR02999 family)
VLARLRAGDAQAARELWPPVYAELRSIAARVLRNERPGHTLQPTALVNEAYLKLVGQQADWQNRAHFIAVAAQAMRRILVDHARARAASKRGGALFRITLDNLDLASTGEPAFDDLLAVDSALAELEQLDSAVARVVELRYFGGLSIEETAEALGVSSATVKREWSVARAWLYRKLRPSVQPG